MRSCLALLFLSACVRLNAADLFEAKALAVSRNIIDSHLPFGTVIDPQYRSATSNQLVTYTRCGDSAIWTGHWLAAEAFRYKVTNSPDALDAVRRAISGLKLLVDVTGSANVLTRCALRADSPYSAGPVTEEKNNGIYDATLGGVAYKWVGHTSRDQYLGAFFGLSVAYDNVTDDTIRGSIRALVSRMLDQLISKNWAIVMPDGNVSTVFWLRPDQELAMLKVGRQVSPARYGGAYETMRSSSSGLRGIISLDAADTNSSYFKFNLDAITFYMLLHNEEASSSVRSSYLTAYGVFRDTVSTHGNAFFNTIDRAIRGNDSKREAETVQLLSDWLLRPTRDVWVDLRSKYKACDDNRACDVIPVPERVPTDFLWQRSPFQMYGGAAGQVESAGIDFILPYWMSRVLGGIAPKATTAASAASSDRGLSSDSIASLFGSGFAAGSRVFVRDAGGQEHAAELFYTSDSQINFVVPRETSTGTAVIRVVRSDGVETHSTSVRIDAVAPGLFSADASGKGPAAALAVQGGSLLGLSYPPVFQCSSPAACVTRPLQPAANSPVYLSLYGTGIRNAHSVHVTFADQDLPVEYTGAQGQFSGLDQINVRLERTLPGRGEQDVVVNADGVTSNPVRILLE